MTADRAKLSHEELSMLRSTAAAAMKSTSKIRPVMITGVEIPLMLNSTDTAARHRARAGINTAMRTHTVPHPSRTGMSGLISKASSISTLPLK